MYIEQVAVDYLCKGATIAVVGASPKQERPSNEIVEYLKQNGMKVFPVNPGHKGKIIHGRECLEKLEDLPEKADIVNVIVSSRFQTKIIDSIKGLDYKPVVWFQPGAENPDAQKDLEDAGFSVLSEACIMVVHTLYCSEDS